MALGLVGAAFILGTLFIFVNFSGNAVFPAECAVVFGSAVHQGSKAGPGIIRRTETAVRLIREKKIERLLLTGGKGEGNAMSEAMVMRNFALKMGIAPDVIMLEEDAASTWQNVQFLLPELKKCASTVGISDRYHLARIRLATFRQDISIMTYPSDLSASAAFEFIAIIRESLAILLYASPFVL